MGRDGKGKWPMRVRAVEWTGVNKELLKTRNRVVDGNSSISHSARIVLVSEEIWGVLVSV
jgi:hypothetical protein